MSSYHNPVLLKECIEGLNINPTGNYVDVTYGGGGHSRAILDKLTTGKLVVFDQDDDAEKNRIDDKRLVFVKSNFKFLKNFLKINSVLKIDGLLADLGVSSYQFDEPERGFSIRFDAKLDMRMNKNEELSAKDVINNYSLDDLARVLYLYGELHESYKIARTLLVARETASINTTEELKLVLKRFTKPGKENKFYAQVFQALRIEVNNELEALKEMLTQATAMLAVGGRIAVISYHSLEDRLVKNLFKTGNFEGKLEKDFYGNCLVPFKLVNRKVIVPDEAEIETNNRARSAKLRIAEKI